MNGAKLADRLSRGAGQAARFSGLPYRVFRPEPGLPPLLERLGRYSIYARFEPQAGKSGLASRVDPPLWSGVFDTALTRVGDYLIGANERFFVAAQRPLDMPLCVRANTVISAYLPAGPDPVTYAGFQIETAQEVTAGWPAYLGLLAASDAGQARTARFGRFELILPGGFPVLPAGAVLLDDGGAAFLVDAIDYGDSATMMRLTRFAP